MYDKGTMELFLNGLDCANCALKIEDAVRNIEGIKTATVNFMAKKLSIEVNDYRALDRIAVETKRIIKKLEPDVEVVIKRNDNLKLNKENGNINKHANFEFFAGAIIFIITITVHFSFWAELVLYLCSYVLLGRNVLRKAGKNILKGHIFDENFLMAIATIGAFAIKEFPEAVTVMLFYKLGMFFQDLALNRSRKSIAALMDIRPDYANLKTTTDIKLVPPDTVNIGDTIIIKPGEKVPLDGIIISGTSMVNTSALTGESLPKEVNPGDDILSGYVNTNGVLTVKVTTEFANSTVSKILNLVEHASTRKSKTENFITKFARYYTPVIVICAVFLVIVPPLIIKGANFSQWLNRALVFLVVSCPCALVISIPLGFFGGIGAASRNGILIKGSNYLEGLNNIDTVIFDKTGTLTRGVFEVTEIRPQDEINKEQLLRYAALGEIYSTHPIAESILRVYGKEISKIEIESYDEFPGYGTRAVVGGVEIFVGSAKLMEQESVFFTEIDTLGTAVYVAVDKKYIGCIIISDEIKEKSFDTIKGLKRLGVKNAIMLTGDRQKVGIKVAEGLGLDGVYSELLPDQKIEKFEFINAQKNTNGNLIFVGDGVNDAPVLARADIGVAMGGLGSDAAIEAADVVLMEDDPSKLVTAIRIAHKTKRIVWQNIIFAFIIKFIVLAMGAGGIATMWEAVFADVGVAIIAIFNSMRIIRSNSFN